MVLPGAVLPRMARQWSARAVVADSGCGGGPWIWWRRWEEEKDNNGGDGRRKTWTVVAGG
ncbi:hypothetical protein [Oryza sativa Japonica Group]|uniref:Uncharacterized protein n=1 Tax=Oryza sativa subsp. japonica TaxID=39947 RepID=Q5JNR2_ORYSJ|nr:hypothetical protein [Oryza sativa Japonica Group]